MKFESADIEFFPMKYDILTLSIAGIEIDLDWNELEFWNDKKKQDTPVPVVPTV